MEVAETPQDMTRCCFVIHKSGRPSQAADVGESKHGRTARSTGVGHFLDADQILYGIYSIPGIVTSIMARIAYLISVETYDSFHR